MSIKAAVSAIALASAMFAAPAFAQDAAAPMEMTISGTAVAEQDMEAVQARCDDLKIAEDTQSLTDDSDSNSSDGNGSDDNGEESNSNAGLINEPAADSETATTLDLTLVTLEDCETGGWYAAE